MEEKERLEKLEPAEALADRGDKKMCIRDRNGGSSWNLRPLPLWAM